MSAITSVRGSAYQHCCRRKQASTVFSAASHLSTLARTHHAFAVGPSARKRLSVVRGMRAEARLLDRKWFPFEPLWPRQSGKTPLDGVGESTQRRDRQRSRLGGARTGPS